MNLKALKLAWLARWNGKSSAPLSTITPVHSGPIIGPQWTNQNLPPPIVIEPERLDCASIIMPPAEPDFPELPSFLDRRRKQ